MTLTAVLISGLAFGVTALVIFVIGILQLKSEKPVGFYSGEKPPEESELTDVKMWNKKHGTMWVIYGCIIVLAWICMLIIGDSVWSVVPCFAGLLLPVIFMIRYHKKLIKLYKIKK